MLISNSSLTLEFPIRYSTRVRISSLQNAVRCCRCSVLTWLLDSSRLHGVCLDTRHGLDTRFVSSRRCGTDTWLLLAYGVIFSSLAKSMHFFFSMWLTLSLSTDPFPWCDLSRPAVDEASSALRWCSSSFYRLPPTNTILPSSLSSRSVCSCPCCPLILIASLCCSCACRHLLVWWFLLPWQCTRRLLVPVAASTKRALCRFCDHFFYPNTGTRCLYRYNYRCLSSVAISSSVLVATLLSIRPCCCLLS